MKILNAADELAPYAQGVLVPTMGGLHAGHVELARLAAKAGRTVVVSVFVNPKQFEESIDFDRYPRDVQADAAMLAPLGVDAVFAPDAETVYPPDAPPSPVRMPPVADGPGLEDRFRPGHLAGVCQVLWRLFELVRPSVAVFGEKDWQQLLLARAVAEQISDTTGDALSILPAPTVREPDGLAMSSRNRFLPPEDRERAAAISQSLRIAAEIADPSLAERAMREHMEHRGLRVEYAVIRDARTLLAPHTGRPARALIAARLGDVRLIDNADWPPAMLPA